MKRITVALLAAGLFASACAQQAPERTPLPPLPDELAFPEVTVGASDSTATTSTAVPEVCTLNYGQGATVLSTESGFPASDILAPGDLIVGVADSAITSADSLLVALAGRQPGDVVSVEFMRGDEMLTESIALGAAPSNPAVGRLGVSLGTNLDGFTLDQLPEVETPTRALVVALEDGLLYMDPTGPTWTQLPLVAPSGNVIWINNDLYGFQLGEPDLLSLVSGETLALPVDDKTVIQVLGAAGAGIIVSVGDNNDGLLSNAEIVSIDLNGPSQQWSLALPDLAGEPVIPAIGWVSGDGTRIAITSVTAAQQRVHTLISNDGEILGGYGAENVPFIPAAALLGGWPDADRLAYVYVDDDTGLTLGIRDFASQEEDTTVDLGEISQVRQMWALPGSDRAVVATRTDSHLISLTTGNTIYRMSQGCAPFVVSATVG